MIENKINIFVTKAS